LSKRQVKARLASRLYMALDQFRLEMKTEPKVLSLLEN